MSKGITSEGVFFNRLDLGFCQGFVGVMLFQRKHSSSKWREKHKKAVEVECILNCAALFLGNDLRVFFRAHPRSQHIKQGHKLGGGFK